MPAKRKGKRARKSTQAVVAQRVAKVLEIRLAGAQFHDIKQYAAENDPATGRPWGVSDRQLWNYIAQAGRQLKDNLDKQQGHLLALHLSKRQALYAQALQTGDLRTALAALKDETELLNLYPGKLSVKDVASLGAQLVALACQRMPPPEHAAFAADVQAVLNTLEHK